MAVVDYVSSWSDRLLSRLYVQFKDDPSWQLWCTAVLGPQSQDLEDAAQTLLLLLDIDNVFGTQLDLLGRLVGQPRAGLVDVTYRLYIKARIAANISDGSPTAIYRVFSLLFPGQALRIDTSPIKSFSLTIGGVVDDVTATVAVGFLGDSKDAGARGLLYWQEQVDAQTFTMALSTSCSKASVITDTTMIVDRRVLAGFPSTGQVVIDAGLTTQETASYILIAGNVMTFSAGLTKAHAIGATVELLGDPGLGWGDAFNPATGGDFASAAQAA